MTLNPLSAGWVQRFPVGDKGVLSPRAFQPLALWMFYECTHFSVLQNLLNNEKGSVLSLTIFTSFVSGREIDFRGEEMNFRVEVTHYSLAYNPVTVRLPELSRFREKEWSCQGPKGKWG